MTTRNHFARAESALRRHALAYPETREDFPWGHSAIKVKGKAFLFMDQADGTFGLSVKLPLSGRLALALPFASPTGYGLGKTGWVSARFGKGDAIPLDMLKEWIDESFRAVAPKKLVARLEDDGPPAAPVVKKKRTQR
jgi:predicted DNA-binding protein (MmcQ/YjbR family)